MTADELAAAVADVRAQVDETLARLDTIDPNHFEKIKGYLGGFADNELRKMLVRAGAVRFCDVVDGNEMET